MFWRLLQIYKNLQTLCKWNKKYWPKFSRVKGPITKFVIRNHFSNSFCEFLDNNITMIFPIFPLMAQISLWINLIWCCLKFFLRNPMNILFVRQLKAFMWFIWFHVWFHTLLILYEYTRMIGITFRSTLV